MTLTRRQKDIVEFIRRFVTKHKYPPTVREIAHGVSLKSSATVQVHLNKLRAKGVLDWEDASTRTIHVLEKSI
jgi:repressor LexA